MLYDIQKPHWVNSWVLLLVIIIFLVSVYLLKAIRNVFFHPLSQFPGPSVFAASRFPYACTSMTGKLASKTHQLHEKYGPVVRLAPNELSFIESSAWDTIYGMQKGQYPPFRKNYDTFNETRNQIGTDSVFLVGDQDHKRMRKVLSHAFSPQALRVQASRLEVHAKELLHGLDQALSCTNGLLDLNQWYTWVAFDIVTDAAFSDSFHCLRQPHYREWPLELRHTWKLIVHVSGLKQILPWLSLVRWIVPTSMLQHQVDRLDMVIERVRKRMSQPSNDRKDFLHHIITNSDLAKAGSGLSQAEILSNTSLLAFAGTETVATLLPALSYLLLCNPRPMKILVHELRSIFPDEDSITTEAVSHIGYLTACIKEALRLFPPTPEGLPRVAPREGAIVSGHWVPGGTYLQVSNFAASVSSANFKHPFSFIPERWLRSRRDGGVHSEQVDNLSSLCQDDLHASQPFSVGPRNCIGQSIAMAEVQLIIAHMTWRYDLHYDIKDGEWTDQPSYLLWERKPLMVRLEPMQ